MYGIRLNIAPQGMTPRGDCFIDAASLSLDTQRDTIEPHINITSPYSSLPNPSNVWLNFTTDEPCSWIDYSLDGTLPTTIAGNTLLENLSEGYHVVTINAEGELSERVGFSTIGFIVDTVEPGITIHSPLNTTYTSDSVWLAATPQDDSISWMGYSLDGAENITLNILVHKLYASLMMQFIDQFAGLIREIHKLMNRSPDKRKLIASKVLEVRVLVTRIVLAYEKIYGAVKRKKDEDIF